VEGAARASALWPSVRAALITLTMLVGLVAGLPLPPANVRERLPPSLSSVLLGLERAQRVFLKPFAFIADEFNLLQRWNLFAGASRERYRISIEGRTRGRSFRVLYRPHEPAHAFEDSRFEYRRVRGAWNPRRAAPQPGYEPFVTWAARRVFRAHPKLDEVRVRMEKIVVLPHGAGYRGTGEYAFEARRTRGEVGE
jgi:hypothetical protein